MTPLQRQAVADAAAASFGIYQVSKDSESSHTAFAQMALNNAWGMLMAVATLFGPAECENVKRLIEEKRGKIIPTESPLAINEVLASRVDMQAIMNLPQGLLLHGVVTYKTKHGETTEVSGMIGKTMMDDRIAIGVKFEDGTVQPIPLDCIVDIRYDDAQS